MSSTPSDDHDAMLADVVSGLSGRPRTLPCKYLYDARGSELFERICQTPEYYVTRADLALHRAHLPEIASRVGPDAHIIELGSGAGIKTRLLLASLESPRAYTPLEISEAALHQSLRELEHEFPHIPIRPVQADYTQPIPSGALALDPPARRRIIYFPGSTIGNFNPTESVAFLERLGRMAGSGGALLVGVDLIKSAEHLLAAYDDEHGITAAFNRNLLERIRRELGARLDAEDFVHEARWDPHESRMEMHLVARRATRIELEQRRFEFERGESIHTESSYKYSVDSFRALAERAGLRSEAVWFDPEEQFSMHWLVVKR